MAPPTPERARTPIPAVVISPSPEQEQLDGTDHHEGRVHLIGVGMDSECDDEIDQASIQPHAYSEMGDREIDADEEEIETAVVLAAAAFATIHHFQACILLALEAGDDGRSMRAAPSNVITPRSVMFEELETISDVAFQTHMRMPRENFDKLYESVSRSESWPRRRRAQISGKKLFASVLYKLMHAETIREIELNFGISHSYFAEYFPKVLQAIIELDLPEAAVCFPSTTELAEDQGVQWAAGRKGDNSDQRYRFLRRCVGAGDGTLIPVCFSASPDNLEAWRCRKGYYCQNVLLVCNYDKTFSFCSCMSEGSSNDAGVVRACGLTELIPEGHFILFDAGISHREKFLTPYKGVRYHLKEWGTHRPENPMELFNLYHATKRASRIEVAIGLLKSRFKCLSFGLVGTPEMMRLQTEACVVLHNYVQRTYGREDSMTIIGRQALEELRERRERQKESVQSHGPIPGMLHAISSPEQSSAEESDADQEDESDTYDTIDQWRDGLAEEAWIQYQTHRAIALSYTSYERVIGESEEEISVQLEQQVPRHECFTGVLRGKR